jgi:hypothetical protein
MSELWAYPCEWEEKPHPECPCARCIAVEFNEPVNKPDTKDKPNNPPPQHVIVQEKT